MRARPRSASAVRAAYMQSGPRRPSRGVWRISDEGCWRTAGRSSRRRWQWLQLRALPRIVTMVHAFEPTPIARHGHPRRRKRSGVGIGGEAIAGRPERFRTAVSIAAVESLVPVLVQPMSFEPCEYTALSDRGRTSINEHSCAIGSIVESPAANSRRDRVAVAPRRVPSRTQTEKAFEEDGFRVEHVDRVVSACQRSIREEPYSGQARRI